MVQNVRHLPGEYKTLCHPRSEVKGYLFQARELYNSSRRGIEDFRLYDKEVAFPPAAVSVKFIYLTANPNLL